MITQVNGPKHATKVHKTRSLSQIKRIVIHHGLTKRGLKGTNYLSYLRYHVEDNNWSIGGYAFGIEPNGDILQGYELTDQTNHVGNYNPFSLGIVLPGDFRYEEPTTEQWKSLYWLLNHLQSVLLPNDVEIVGHSELPGYEWKQCPCLDMDQIRRNAKNYSDKEIVITLPKGEKTMILNRKDKGSDVRELQEDLNALGYNAGTVDGIFGLQTETALKSFQRATNIKVDGVAGPQTFAKIKAAMEANNKVATPKKESVTFTLGGRKYRITQL